MTDAEAKSAVKTCLVSFMVGPLPLVLYWGLPARRLWFDALPWLLNYTIGMTTIVASLVCLGNGLQLLEWSGTAKQETDLQQ